MQTNGDKSATERPSARYTVHQAADALGTTVEGVRSRIRRGSLDSLKVNGTVYVLLTGDHTGPVGTDRDKSETGPDKSPVSDALLEAKDETISELRNQVEHLKRVVDTRDEELRRKDHLLAATLERIPELEAPGEKRIRSDTVTEDIGKGDTSPEPQEQSERRSWWSRFFRVE